MAIEVCCVYHTYHHSTRFTQHWPFHFKYLKHLTSTHKRLTKFGTRNQSWHRFGESSVPKNSREGPKNLQHLWTTISTIFYNVFLKNVKRFETSAIFHTSKATVSHCDEVCTTKYPNPVDPVHFMPPHARTGTSVSVTSGQCNCCTVWACSCLEARLSGTRNHDLMATNAREIDALQCKKNHELINVIDLATCRSQNIPNRSLAITYICSQTMQHCMWFGRQISWCRIPTYFPASNCGK